MKNSTKIFLFCVLTAALIGCDQATKSWAKQNLKGQEPRVYLNNMARLEYIENTGAFLSFGDDLPPTVSLWVFSILPLVVLTAIFIYAIRHANGTSFAKMLPFALIVAGGVGNIIDRILYDRHVTDFMNLGIGNLRTGIFNVADVYVSIGVVMLLVFNFKERKSGTAG
jgi:signal peptidase II